MSLKKCLFTKDSRRSSLDLTANVHHAIKKLCKDKPIKLTQLKTEYDRYFKDKISTKPPETISAVLKGLDNDIITSKVYVMVNNREMTDLLLGLRHASYADQMANEDSPHLSKERLLQIVKEQGNLGIHVRDLEERYRRYYGTRPSYLPFKGLKEFLHRTNEVELVSSGKTLRVRWKQVIPTMLRRMSSTLRSGSTFHRTPHTSSLRQSKTQYPMSTGFYRMSDASQRNDLSSMTRSVYIPSTTAGSSDDNSGPSSHSGSESGSVDMTVSMVLPPQQSFQIRSVRFQCDSRRQSRNDVRNIGSNRQAPEIKEIIETILSELPVDGMPLKTLNDELLSILGELPAGMTTVELLTKEFKQEVQIAEAADGGLRVFRLNSPMLPRRTIAEVYTKLALQSNRKPSDRVLKVLKGIYGKREDLPTLPHSLGNPFPPSPEEPNPQAAVAPPATDSRNVTVDKDDEMEEAEPNAVGHKAVVEELREKLQSRAGRSKIPVRQRSKQAIIDELRRRLKDGPIGYSDEFQEITRGIPDQEQQAFLAEVMSALNVCIKLHDGRMILQVN